MMHKLDEVTRVEVITREGRAYVNWMAEGVSLSFQDEGRTLKVFVGDDHVQADG
jgi:hypothetical protein